MDLMKFVRLFPFGPRILAVILWGTILSCAPDELCFTDNTTLVEIKFLKTIYAGTDSATLENDTLIFNSVKALDTDSVFLSADTLSALSLPINTGADRTVFLFDSDQGMDTLELTYKRFQRFISEECGPEQIIDSLNSGQVSFDSVVVVNKLLNEGIPINVEIYP